jgi:hypothetical protein
VHLSLASLAHLGPDVGGAPPACCPAFASSNTASPCLLSWARNSRSCLTSSLSNMSAVVMGALDAPRKGSWALWTPPRKGLGPRHLRGSRNCVRMGTWSAPSVSVSRCHTHTYMHVRGSRSESCTGTSIGSMLLTPPRDAGL